MTKNKRRGQQKQGQKQRTHALQQKSKIPAIVPTVTTTGSAITKSEIENQQQRSTPEGQWGGRIGTWLRRGSLVVRTVKTLVAAAVSVCGLYIAYQAFVTSNRAIVNIANIEVSLPVLNFTLQKTGGLPATAVEVRVKEQRFPTQTMLLLPKILKKGDIVEGEEGGETVHKIGDDPIAPGESTYKFGVLLHDFKPGAAERLRSGEDVLMVIGTIIYDDGTWLWSRQTIPYCRVYNPFLPGSQWYDCPTKRVGKVQGRGGDVVYQGKGEEGE